MSYKFFSGRFELKPGFDNQLERSSNWNERLLMAAVIVTMVLSLLGYMRA